MKHIEPQALLIQFKKLKKDYGNITKEGNVTIINIDKTISPMQQINTLFHEFTHFISYLIKARKNGKFYKITDEHSEIIAKRIEKVVAKEWKEIANERII
jgi:uncharacterized protein YdcH (DUF465 family)